MINAIIKIVPEDYPTFADMQRAIYYIYRINTNKPLPIYCYGAYPPTADNIINQINETICHSSIAPTTYLRHFIISFPTNIAYSNTLWLFADSIAKFFCNEYQICYACHQNTDNLHFHYMISAVSYIPATNNLDNEIMSLYLTQMSALAETFGISLKRKD